MATSIDGALLSLEGLSVGDAFGELFFTLSPASLASRDLPPGPWPWTDDTHMALSVVETLRNHGRIQQDALAQAFTARFLQDPLRGYGQGASMLLATIARGADWREVAPALFGGGSYGNGGAMRAAPIGGFFSGDPDQAATEARHAAAVTHAHPEGQAGAMAVAAAAALVALPHHSTGLDLLRESLAFVPPGVTREGISAAIHIPPDDLAGAVAELGSGSRVSSQDTVPFCLWSAAHHLNSFEAAMWNTVRALGDRDTTCAIVGGIVALSTREVPPPWVQRREPLPPGFSR